MKLREILFSLEGRISRSTYWLYLLLLVPIWGSGWMIDLAASRERRFFYWIGLLICAWPGIALNVKRCHDRNRSGWFYLVCLIPLVQLWYVVEIGFLPGTPGRNRFDTLDRSTRLELEEAAAAEAVLPPMAAARSRPPPWVVASLAIATAIAVAVVHFRQPPPEQRVIKLTLLPPEKTSFRAIAVSYDGRWVAFTARDAAGKTQLWVRTLEALAPQPLAGTEGASSPFWSPDSRWLGFFAQGKLKKIEASGGPPLTLASAPSPLGGAWSRYGVIVFASNAAGPLYQIPEGGGEPRPVTQLDALRQEIFHSWPQFLPDGRLFLYFSTTSEPGHQGIYLDSLDSGDMGSKKRTRLLATDSSAAYAGQESGLGYLLFARERILMAQPFDPAKLELSGEAFPVAEAVGFIWQSRFSVSESGSAPWRAVSLWRRLLTTVLPEPVPPGVLIYDSISDSVSGKRHLTWFDRNGKPLQTLDSSGTYWSLDLSPDGRRVAANRTDPQTRNQDIWVFDLARGITSRFTFDPAREGAPVWSPDGRLIAFYSSRDGPQNLYQKAASGAGEEQLLLKTDQDKYPTDWSRDGRFLLYTEQDSKSAEDLWVLPLTAEAQNPERKPMPFLRTEFSERDGRFSPDGKWVAYQSNETGRYEVYVRTFSPQEPGGGGKWQVSVDGGVEPRWRKDGKELFFHAPDRKLMAVEVKAGARFQAGVPRPLFQTRIQQSASIGRYAVTADGRRFLIVSEVEEAFGEPATVLLNWTAGLKK